jgi:hypothetical protein
MKPRHAAAPIACSVFRGPREQWIKHALFAVIQKTNLNFLISLLEKWISSNLRRASYNSKTLSA